MLVRCCTLYLCADLQNDRILDWVQNQSVAVSNHASRAVTACCSVCFNNTALQYQPTAFASATCIADGSWVRCLGCSPENVINRQGGMPLAVTIVVHHYVGCAVPRVCRPLMMPHLMLRSQWQPQRSSLRPLTRCQKVSTLNLHLRGAREEPSRSPTPVKTHSSANERGKDCITIPRICPVIKGRLVAKGTKWFVTNSVVFPPCASRWRHGVQRVCTTT